MQFGNEKERRGLLRIARDREVSPTARRAYCAQFSRSGVGVAAIQNLAAPTPAALFGANAGSLSVWLAAGLVVHGG